jgi:hypothetical protein
LSCLVLSCLVFVFVFVFALSLSLSCLVLSCLALPCLVLSCLVLSCLVSCLVLSCLLSLVSCLVSCLVFVKSSLVQSCPVLSCLALPCLVLSCLALPCAVLCCVVLCCVVVVVVLLVCVSCCLALSLSLSPSRQYPVLPGTTRYRRVVVPKTGYKTPTERSNIANLTEIASVGLTDLWHENIHHLLGSANLPDAISHLKDSSHTCCTVRLALAAVNAKADRDGGGGGGGGGGLATSMDDLEHKDLGLSASSVDRLCVCVCPGGDNGVSCFFLLRPVDL